MEVRKVDIVSSLLSMDCEEALHAIFLSLDGSSLAACSLVCKSWRNFIQQRVWRCPRVRPVLEAKLRQQWRLSKPTILDRQIEGETQGFDIVCDDELTLVGTGWRRRGKFNSFHTGLQNKYRTTKYKY